MLLYLVEYLRLGQIETEKLNIVDVESLLFLTRVFQGIHFVLTSVSENRKYYKEITFKKCCSCCNVDFCLGFHRIEVPLVLLG